MYAFVPNLEEHLRTLVNDPVSPVSPLRLVVVEAHPDYPGELVFQVVEGEGAFYARYKAWVSCYLVLNELFNLQPFVTQLCQDGWEVVFGPSTEPILTAMMYRWTQPLKIEGYELHPFQQYALNRAFEQDFWFFNWATGSGKSAIVAPAGGKELFARGQIDVVVAATLSKSKENLRRAFEKAGLDAVVNDGTKPKRIKGYAQGHQVYVMNYEKLRVDYAPLAELITHKRVLFVFDETHRLVTDNKPNLHRLAFEKLLRVAATGTKVWPMSASVVNGNPLRYRDVFNLNGHPRTNPLGSRTEFERRYADEVKTIELKTKNDKTFDLTVYDWNLTRLQEIRHRVGDRTQAVRKTDPGVREHFKGLQTIVEPIQVSREEMRLADHITDLAWEVYCRGESLAPYYLMLRTATNIPTALLRSGSEVVKEALQSDGGTLNKLIAAAGTGSKIEALNEQLESIREAGDKVLVFTHWTNLTLHLIEPLITVPHVTHYGTGQTNKESQRVQDDFQSDPDLTCFLTSDAGAHGLNMTCARYCISYEPTYSYDDSMQRASRIDRSDSHLDGLTYYVYITENSVEERIWRMNNARRAISAAVQGTEEAFSHGDEDRERALRSEAENMAWAIFGDRL